MMNFTIGKYYNADSLIHKLDPRCKLGFLFIYIISCFIDTNIYLYLFLVSILGMYICISAIPAKLIIGTIKPVIIFSLLMAILNIFTTAGVAVWEWSFISITREGLYKGIYVFIRWILVVVACGIFTYTTKPMDIMRGLEKGLKLKSGIAMIISISIRFLPIMADEMRKIKLAMEIRGANFKHKNIIKRVKVYIGLMRPLMQSSIDRANNLALAMDARCYISEKKRTSIHPLKYQFIDYIFFVMMILFFIITILVSIFM